MISIWEAVTRRRSYAIHKLIKATEQSLYSQQMIDSIR
jgi:hypothetical protein